MSRTSAKSAAAVLRADAFARFFETVHEGLFIGRLRPGAASDGDDGRRAAAGGAAADGVEDDAVEDEGGATLAANPHLRAIFGYPGEASEATVRPFAEARFADPAARRAFFDRLATHHAVTDYLLRMRRVDGSPVWVEVTARAEPLDAAGAFRVDALVRDVSERRKLDEQSRDLHQQLLQAEKLAALGQTVSGVAHELNNPLATILSWAERLVERRLEEPAHRGVTVILGEAERAARIVRNLLTFVRKRQSTRAMIDVNDVIRETLQLRAYEHRLTNIAVSEAFGGDLPAVFADAHQIQQVLLNLILNAEHAMLTAHGRGALAIRTWYDAGRPAAIIEVCDDGPGVAPEVTSQIFDAFFTTKEVGKGTGLGLTVAHAIVQEHGGRISVTSRPEGGAAFRVELPVAGTKAAKTAPRLTAPLLETVRGASVLVVEDEPALAEAVSDGLSDAGLIVTSAGNGDEALTRLRAGHFDLVICDLQMPHVSGMTFYRALTDGSAPTTPPVIFVTGDGGDADTQRFLDESRCRWLAKPFRLSDLLRATRETLDATRG